MRDSRKGKGMREIHDCGGAVLHGRLDGRAYQYCHECGAFSFLGDVPSGTDVEANNKAWDDGELESPSST